MKKIIVLLLASMLVLSGCTKSNIVKGGQDYSDMPQPVEGIVWEQLWEEWDEMYTDQDLYPFSETVNGGVYADENTMKFFILLNQEISKEEAAEYATTVLKGLGDLMAGQNPDLTASGDDSYGSYMDKYNIYVMVSPDATKSDESTWILEDTIPAGEYREVSGE